MTLPAGRWGAWSTALRLAEQSVATEAAAELEAAGCSALWMTGALDDPFERVAALLGDTTTTTVATGILSIWTMSATDVAAAVAALPDPSRFLLGLGVSHPRLVDRDEAGRYAKPLTRMRGYLEELDATGVAAVGQESRVLAALGPRMLELSADRAAGAHPYLTTAQHTSTARQSLGPDSFLAPTQMTLLEPDPDLARTIARDCLAMYLRQPNYVNSWLRQGFTADDVDNGGSDRLVDTLVAWGTPEQVAVRLHEHVDAGADHVCVQMLSRDASWREQPLPVADWRRLLEALA